MQPTFSRLQMFAYNRWLLDVGGLEKIKTPDKGLPSSLETGFGAY